MDDLFSRRQYEEAASDDDAAATNAAIEAARIDMHTSMPGIIESFNPDKQTAVVRPVVQKYFRGEGFKPLPELMDVPVQFPRGGGFVLTFPVRKGDECLLVFSERAIDNWFESGKVQPPHEFRTHDLSDASAVMGISSIPKVVTGFNASAVELRSLDGNAKVQIDGGQNITVQSDQGDITASSTAGMIKLNAPPGATPLVNGVLIGAHPCPVLGIPHSSFGPPCARVLGGQT